MKSIKAFIVVISLVLTAIISYNIGVINTNHFHSKDYQAACILNDCCRNMVDNLGNEAEEVYYEYLDNLECYKDLSLTKEDISKYYWSY